MLKNVSGSVFPKGLDVLTWLLAATSVVSLVVGFVANDFIRKGYWAWSRQGLIDILTFCVLMASFFGLWLIPRKVDRRLGVAVACLWFVVAAGFPALGTVVLVWASAFAIGSWFLEAMSPDDSLHKVAAAATVGLAVLLAVMQVLVHFPINKPEVYAALLILPILLRFRSLKKLGKDFIHWSVQRQPDRFRRLLFLIIAGLFIIHSVNALLPESGWDALTQHLMAPTQVKANGLWDFSFHEYVWALMSMGCDWLYALAYMLGGETAAKLFNLSVFVVLAVMLWHFAKAKSSELTATAVVAFFISLPIAFTETGTLFVENALTLFGFAAFLFVIHLRQRTSLKMSLAFFAVAGAAMAVKLHGIPLVTPLVAIHLFHVWKNGGFPRLLRTGILGAIVLFASGLLPYIYAFIMTGNPTFPYFNALFKSDFYPKINILDIRWTGHFSWKILYDMTFHTNRFGEAAAGAMGFYLFLLLPAASAVTLKRRDQDMMIAAAVSCFFAFAVLVNVEYFRYLYPVFPLVSVMMCPLLFTVFSRGKKIAVLVAGFIVVTQVGFLATSGFSQFEYKALVSMHAPPPSRYIVTSIREINDRINSDYGRQARVLYLWSPFGAGLMGRPVYANWYNYELSEAIDKCSSEAEVFKLLADRKVTHVVLDYQPDVISHKPVISETIEKNGIKTYVCGQVAAFKMPAWSSRY